ncbi:uncharacterized protein LOC131281798 [Anopheles ziemanni]|uniref:uncharacterized protein LOC131265451 n=1 Tax=Anopheles coustani TaxID=139045 RepID=UPI00265A85BD|nr:uncharacterized protein LOC131265451 [Anopheles coustani]XP_058167132.1 uncharacterized protein LOC131281798 [Anopheles ziemanni]
MKAAIFVLIAVGTVLVVADDFKKGPGPHHEDNHHEFNGQQHQLKQQHPQEHLHPAGPAHQENHHQAAPAHQEHQLKQQHEHQPQPHQHHKRETPKQENVAGQSTTAAPKATVDPKQPSALPAIVSQPPKQKRDTLADKPVQARPTTASPAKGVSGSNQQKKNQPRPTGSAKVNRDQPKVPLQVPQPGANNKAPAAAPAPSTANPAKKA